MTPLQELRLGRGWRQEETAGRLGLDRRTYSAYETGKRAPPADVIVRVADLYGLASARVDDLTRWSGGLRATSIARTG
jgi:transcriptional regulator with XRE-family HTH domain